MHDDFQHVCDKVSASASTVSTTVASKNSGRENSSGWGTCDSSSWTSFSVAQTENLQKAVKIIDAENACLSNCLITLQQKLDTKSKRLREIGDDVIRK